MPDLDVASRRRAPALVIPWDADDEDYGPALLVSDDMTAHLTAPGVKCGARRQATWAKHTIAEMRELVKDLHDRTKLQAMSEHVRVRNRTIERANAADEPDRLRGDKPVRRLTAQLMLYPTVNFQAETLFEKFYKRYGAELRKNDVTDLALAGLASAFSFAQSQSTASAFYLQTEQRRNLWTTKVLSLLHLSKDVSDEDGEFFTFTDTNTGLPFRVMSEKDLASTSLYKQICASRVREKYDEIVADIPLSESLDKWLGITRPVLARATALQILDVTRLLRAQHTLGQQHIKTALSTTCGKPNTVDKFRHQHRLDIPRPDLKKRGAWVLHLGSGPSTALSRTAYPCSVYCVDPQWEKSRKFGFRGKLEDFLKGLRKKNIAFRTPPALISSDMCGYLKDRTHFINSGTTGEMLTSMDPEVTNKLALEVIRYFEEEFVALNGEHFTGIFDLKVGIEKDPPERLACRSAVLLMNQRPANAELIVSMGKPIDEHTNVDLVTLMDAASHAMACANVARAHFESTGTFPNREYCLPKDFAVWEENADKHALPTKPVSMYYSSRLLKSRIKMKALLDLDYLEHEDLGADDEDRARNYEKRVVDINKLVERINNMNILKAKLLKMEVNPMSVMEIRPVDVDFNPLDRYSMQEVADTAEELYTDMIR